MILFFSFVILGIVFIILMILNFFKYLNVFLFRFFLKLDFECSSGSKVILLIYEYSFSKVLVVLLCFDFFL